MSRIDLDLKSVWQNALFVAAVIAVIIGLWAFTMTITIWIWVAIVVAAVLVLYFGIEWLFSKGRPG